MPDIITFTIDVTALTSRLDTLIGVLKQMVTSQQQFDAALAPLVTLVGNIDSSLQSLATNASDLVASANGVNTALNQFITDYQAKMGVDLTNELNAVTTMTNTLTTDATAVSNTVASLGTVSSDLQTAAANIVAADPNA